MNLAGEITISTVFSGATLLSAAGIIWRMAKADADRQATAREVREIKAIIGNGEPGAVVKRQVCEALHGSVNAHLALIREDIRSLHDAVGRLNGHRHGES